MLRFFLWRTLGALAALLGVELVAWCLRGGPGRELRGHAADAPLPLSPGTLLTTLVAQVRAIWNRVPVGILIPACLWLACIVLLAAVVLLVRVRARRRRRYVRLRIDPYRMDSASAEAVVRMFAALHKRLLRGGWRRILRGQPSISLEVHHAVLRGKPTVWLALTTPADLQSMVETALQGAYPNCRLAPNELALGRPPVILRLRKRAAFIKRVKMLDRFEHAREPPVNRLMSVMGACGQPAFVQLAMTPAPACFESLARRLYKSHESRLSRERRERLLVRDRSLIDDLELRNALEVQHSPLFFVDLRVIAQTRCACEQIASELRVESAENRLIERGTALRHGILGTYRRRVERGEGNPVPSLQRGVFAPSELAAIWQLPSTDYLAVPFARAALPVAPAAPGIWRPPDGEGTLCDAHGPVSIHPALRKQNTAVPGTVEQGKSSYLVATVAEDVRRERCAVIVLDPKGDAADAAMSVVPPGRTCTLLDFAHPTCGFNPLAVDAPADVIADYVVAALKNLFTDGGVILGL